MLTDAVSLPQELDRLPECPACISHFSLTEVRKCLFGSDGDAKLSLAIAAVGEDKLRARDFLMVGCCLRRATGLGARFSVLGELESRFGVIFRVLGGFGDSLRVLGGCVIVLGEIFRVLEGCNTGLDILSDVLDARLRVLGGFNLQCAVSE